MVNTHGAKYMSGFLFFCLIFFLNWNVPLWRKIGVSKLWHIFKINWNDALPLTPAWWRMPWNIGNCSRNCHRLAPLTRVFIIYAHFCDFFLHSLSLHTHYRNHTRMGTRASNFDIENINITLYRTWLRIILG